MGHATQEAWGCVVPHGMKAKNSTGAMHDACTHLSLVLSAFALGAAAKAKGSRRRLTGVGTGGLVHQGWFPHWDRCTPEPTLWLAP